MKIKTKVTLSDYIGLMFILYYRKPRAILILSIGIALLVMPTLSYGSDPIFDIIFGLMVIIIIPFSIYLTSKKISSPIFGYKKKLSANSQMIKCI